MNPGQQVPGRSYPACMLELRWICFNRSWRSCFRKGLKAIKSFFRYLHNLDTDKLSMFYARDIKGWKYTLIYVFYIPGSIWKLMSPCVYSISHPVQYHKSNVQACHKMFERVARASFFFVVSALARAADIVLTQVCHLILLYALGKNTPIHIIALLRSYWL